MPSSSNGGEKPNLFDPSDLPSVDEVDNIVTSFTPITILRDKVVIVGDAECGKTSLIQSFLSEGQHYPRKYSMTTEVDLTVGEVAVPGTNVTVDLFVYDVPGQSIFNQRSLQANLFDGASYVVCVYDLSSRQSFQNCSKWIQSVRSAQTSSTKKTHVFVVANKIDLRGDEDNMMTDSRSQVDEAEGSRFARENGYGYFECSSSHGSSGWSGIESLFQSIASQTYQRYAT